MIRRLLLVTGILVLTSSIPAGAHGTGAIHLASKQIPIGGELVLKGEKLGVKEELRLELRGILEKYPVGVVRTDAKEAFSARFTLPPQVPAGAYSLVAIAADGDVGARADLVITAARSAAVTGMGGMPGMDGHEMQEMSGAHATAAMMKLDQVTSPGEWMIIVSFILISVGTGALLLAKSRKTMSDGSSLGAGLG